MVAPKDDIRPGERVRRYEIELLRDDQWRSLASGSCIGHERIHRLATAVRGEALRLRILESTGRPHIRRMAAFVGGSRRSG